MEIPKKLQQPEIKFVLLEKGCKKPFQMEWTNKVISYNQEELLKHLSEGGNYGVMGGGDKKLVVIDFDNVEIQNKIVPLLPKTFTVKTGTNKLHKYFFSDGCESFKIFDEEMNTLADIQGEGKQVVGANSIHPNGNKYEVVDDSDIAFLPYGEIKALLMPYDKKPKKEKKVFEKPKSEIEDNFIDKLKNNIDIEDVLSSFGIDTTKNPTQCPFHNSKGGKCLGFDREVAHCFHCDGAWNIFSLVKEMKKCDFKYALEYLANLAGMENELQESKRRYFDNLKQEERTEKLELKSEFLDLIKDKKINSATELIVEYIKKNNHIFTTKDDNNSEMWIYREGIYVPQGKSEVKIMMREILDVWFNQYYYNQVMNKLMPDTMIEQDSFFSINYPYEIPVENGILNILTRELQEFSCDKIFFNKLPVNYEPNADCPQIEKFLKEVLANEDDINVFYEIVGYCLLKEMKLEKAFMFVGDGRNGKDKSLELIKRLIGVENCCSVPLSSLMPDSFIISSFFNKMVNIAGEINNQDLKDTSVFKQLTGRSLVSAPRKFLNPVTFVNFAKFIFACNELPMVYDNSKGFWDRWALLEFPYTFVTKNELNPNNPQLKLRDEDIITKITTPEELSGLLNKALDGLDRLLFNKNFSTTLGSQGIKELWIRKSNSVMAFCLDMIEENYDSFITKKQFRKKYTDYCKKHQIKVKTDYVVKRTLEEMFGVTEGLKNTVTNFQERVWDGIKWK